MQWGKSALMQIYYVSKFTNSFLKLSLLKNSAILLLIFEFFCFFKMSLYCLLERTRLALQHIKSISKSFLFQFLISDRITFIMSFNVVTCSSDMSICYSISYFSYYSFYLVYSYSWTLVSFFSSFFSILFSLIFINIINQQN